MPVIIRVVVHEAAQHCLMHHLIYMVCREVKHHGENDVRMGQSGLYSVAEFLGCLGVNAVRPYKLTHFESVRVAI